MPSPTMPPIRTPLEESGGLPARPGVILFGLATTAAALAGVWFAGQHDVNIMGWYANYVIPAGAILVGLAASSGYGLGSYVTGTKVSGRLLVMVLALLTASYFAAKYLQQHGYRVVPVNPRYGEVLGERCYPSLADIPQPVSETDA